jgi:hypothetical protein
MREQSCIHRDVREHATRCWACSKGCSESSTCRGAYPLLYVANEQMRHDGCEMSA